MADPATNIHIDQRPPLNQTPLLNDQQDEPQQEQPPERDVRLDQALRKLEIFLTFLGFNQSSIVGFLLSWSAFIVIGLLLPVTILELAKCSGCDEYQIKNFELDIVASQACIAAVALICVSRNLRKHDIRKFLFVDRCSGHMCRLTHLYIQQIKDSLRVLLLWSLPCFILKVIREVLRISYVQHESWWSSTAILVSLILSWSYVSTISLTASILFHLVCNLQVIHFDDYAKLLETESDVLVLIEEHIHLRLQLSKISHRFRIFLLLEFCVVTASQCITLLLTTGYSGIITVINGGDFAVSSIVQVVGIILCLHAATRISHRAQGVASLASRWHALATCGSTDASLMRASNSGANLQVANLMNSLRITYSESDLESLDFMSTPTNTYLTSHVSYHKRQAYVTYLQNNPGGITIFGWTIDRGLITTIFFIELSLVTFVLGKTIVFTST